MSHENRLPTVEIGNCEITRLIVGGNPFSGISHKSNEMDQEMMDYYTVGQIKETLSTCEAHGINTVLARGDNHITRLLNEYWNEGGTLQWIAQTAPERKSLEANIRQISSRGARCCFIHGGEVDRMFQEGQIESLKASLALIQDCGMVPGLGTHNPDVVRYAEEKGFPVAFYMVCFYNIPSRMGRFHDTPVKRDELYVTEDRATACEVIGETPKPCLAYKILAAGRNEPKAAFRYAFEHIKPTDAVVVGMFPKYHPTQVQEDVEIVRKLTGSLDKLKREMKAVEEVRLEA